MRISIELSEHGGTMRTAEQPSTASAPAPLSGGRGHVEGFGEVYTPAPASIAIAALSASAINAGPPPRELIDRAEMTLARSPTTAAGDDDRSTLYDGGSAPTPSGSEIPPNGGLAF